jgi:hypothetical protein
MPTPRSGSRCWSTTPTSARATGWRSRIWSSRGRQHAGRRAVGAGPRRRLRPVSPVARGDGAGAARAGRPRDPAAARGGARPSGPPARRLRGRRRHQARPVPQTGAGGDA